MRMESIRLNQRLDGLLAKARDHCKKSPHFKKLQSVIEFLSPEFYALDEGKGVGFARYNPKDRKVYINKKLLGSNKNNYLVKILLHEVAHGVLYSQKEDSPASIQVSDEMRDADIAEGDYLYHGTDWVYLCKLMDIKVPDVYYECGNCRTESFSDFEELAENEKRGKTHLKAYCPSCDRRLNLKDIFMLNAGTAFSSHCAELTNELIKLNRLHGGKLILLYGERKMAKIDGNKTYYVTMSMPSPNKIIISYKEMRSNR